jgi:hypothetical protein
VPVDRRTAVFKSGATVTTGLDAPTSFALQTGSLLLSTWNAAATRRGGVTVRLRARNTSPSFFRTWLTDRSPVG